MKKIILIIAILISSNLYAQTFTEGKHYKKLNKTITTEVAKGKIEVRELFWYYCPHCYSIEEKVEKYIKSKPDVVSFVRQPAVFSKRWVNGAIFYFVLLELGEIERLHSKLFDAIHIDNIIFNSKDDFIDWLIINNVNKQKASAAFSSFTINTKVNKAKLNSRKYQINGVPAFVVNGKYTTSVKEAGSESKLFEVINYLVKKEAKK